MSQKSSSASFITGGIIGAAIVYLTCTDKGKVLLKEGLDYIDRKLSGCLDQEAEDNSGEAGSETVTEE